MNIGIDGSDDSANRTTLGAKGRVNVHVRKTLRPAMATANPTAGIGLCHAGEPV